VDAGRRVGRQLEPLDRRRRSCHTQHHASSATPAGASIRVFGSHRGRRGVAS
jgi:hypothetical protein